MRQSTQARVNRATVVSTAAHALLLVVLIGAGSGQGPPPPMPVDHRRRVLQRRRAAADGDRRAHGGSGACPATTERAADGTDGVGAVAAARRRRIRRAHPCRSTARHRGRRRANAHDSARCRARERRSAGDRDGRTFARGGADRDCDRRLGSSRGRGAVARAARQAARECRTADADEAARVVDGPHRRRRARTEVDAGAKTAGSTQPCCAGSRRAMRWAWST